MQLLLPQVFEMSFVIHQEKKWREKVILTVSVLSRVVSTVNLSHKPRLDLCCDMLHHLQEVYNEQPEFMFLFRNLHILHFIFYIIFHKYFKFNFLPGIYIFMLYILY